jgi:hypothetical protein
MYFEGTPIAYFKAVSRLMSEGNGRQVQNLQLG